MTQILIVTDSTEGTGAVVYRERVDPIHLASEHSRCQLAERLAWAVGDAARTRAAERTEVVFDEVEVVIAPEIPVGAGATG